MQMNRGNRVTATTVINCPPSKGNHSVYKFNYITNEHFHQINDNNVIC